MINLALVGCGGMANGHANTLKGIADARIVALCDTVTAQTRAFKEKHFPDAAEYDSYDRLLESPPAKLDGVILVTPHTTHFAQSKAALERGINVLVEKPMVTGSADAYELWRTVNRTRKLLGIAFQGPYSSEFLYLAGQRDADQLGRVQMISGWMSQNWLKGTAGKWRQEPKLSGGGQMYDSGAHMLNSIMWLMNDPVVEVGCFYDKCGSPVDINGVAIMKFQNGALGSVCIGGNCPTFGTDIQIQTDRMLIRTGQYGGTLEMSPQTGKKLYPHVPVDDRAGAGTPQLNFVNALLGKEPLRAPVRYGVLLSALMDALYESADTGKLVKVKPVPREIGQ